MSSRPFLYLSLNLSYVPVGRPRANNVFKADTVSSDLLAVIRPAGYWASCAEQGTVGKIYFKMRDNEPNNCEQTILKIKTHDNIKLHWLRWLLASIVTFSSKKVQSQNWIIKSFFRSTRNFFVNYLTRQRWTIKILVIFLWDVTLEEDLQERPHFSS